MAFETSSAFISARTSSLETNLKEKLALFSYSVAVARTLGSFLHVTKAFKIVFRIAFSLGFLHKNHNFHNLGY